MKSDPYANCAELRPNNASVVADLNVYHWNDHRWMHDRAKETRQSLGRSRWQSMRCIWVLGENVWKMMIMDSSPIESLRQ